MELEIEFKKQKKKQFSFFLKLVIAEIVAFILDVVFKNDIFFKANVIFFSCIIITVVLISLKEKNYRKAVTRKFLPPLLLITTLIIPYVAKVVFFPTATLELNTVIQVYVSYLSFASALILGYVVYIDNVKKEERTLQKNAKILLDNLHEIDLWMIRINRGETVKKFENVIDWEKYYYEIYYVIEHDELVVKHVLSKIYNFVDMVNRQIDDGHTDRVRKLYDIYLDDELKSILPYNCFDVEHLIFSIVNPWFGKPKLWYDDPKIKNEIHNKKKLYENEIYQWISIFFKINNISECDRDNIEPLIYEWMSKKNDIKKWIEFPPDKRKLRKLISEVVNKINFKSKDLNLCWDVISLKDNA